jgi:dUTP pyrophosphatase
MKEISYSYIQAIRMECKIIHPDGKLPFRKRVTDAAYDVYSVEDTVVPPHGMRNVHTGIIVTAPPGYYITVEARSSMGKEGIIPMRGIIDSSYTGELMVILTNQSDKEYKISKDDRIAQIILNQQNHMNFELVEEFSSEYSHRGEAGWGSSGK